MSRLYELTGKYLELARLIDDPDIPPEALADTLEGLEGEIEIKAEGLLKWIANVDADIQALDHEIRRLGARKKVLENGQGRLREYLRHNMEVTGIYKIECSLFLITLAKGRAIVVVDDEGEIPKRYKAEKVQVSIDRAALLRDLKAGQAIPGARLGTSNTSLRIK